MHLESSTQGGVAGEAHFILARGDENVVMDFLSYKTLNVCVKFLPCISDKIVTRIVCEGGCFSEGVNIANRKYPPKI